MLTREGCKARRERLWRRASGQVEWMVFADPRNLMYFANYFQTPFIFRTANAAAVLILGKDGASILVADSSLRVCTEKAFVDEAATPIWYDGKTTAPPRDSLLIRNVLERLTNCPGNTFGVDSSHLPAGIADGLRAARPGVALVDVEAVLNELRRSKDADEIALLQRSMDAMTVGLNAARHLIQPGMTELQAYLAVERACCEAAGEQALVYGDFVSGPRTEKGGGQPTQRVIAQGELVLLDFSLVLYGYRGDFANTFACGARAGGEQRRLYDACKEAMAAGEALLEAGRPCKEIDGAVRAIFESKSLEASFHSHSGHGLGLGHPDPPYIVRDSSDVLVQGDVVTLEPGLFVEGVGGMRIEHNYLITETGFERMTHQHLTIDAID